SWGSNCAEAATGDANANASASQPTRPNCLQGGMGIPTLYRNPGGGRSGGLYELLLATECRGWCDRQRTAHSSSGILNSITIVASTIRDRAASGNGDTRV